MKQVPDRKKMRREYLRKKAQVYVMTACFVVLLLLMLVGMFHSLLAGHLTQWLSVGYSAVMGIVIVGNVLLGLQKIRRAQEQARQAYIPPVTPATIPAEEVLVRMAEEPLAPNETLLRATAKGEETKAEELLRSSTSG